MELDIILDRFRNLKVNEEEHTALQSASYSLTIKKGDYFLKKRW